MFETTMVLKKAGDVPTNSGIEKQCIVEASNEQLVSGCRVLMTCDHEELIFGSPDLVT